MLRCLKDGSFTCEGPIPEECKLKEDAMTHSILMCLRCGDVISQCRCMSKDKPINYSICDKCKRETTDERDHCEEVEETS